MALFDGTSDTDVTLETLVGEGKKYNDPDQLAKAYSHADATIKAREVELAQLRDELKTRISVEDQIKKLNTKPQEPDSGQPRQDPPPTPSATPTADLDQRIKEALQANQRENQIIRNQDEVRAKLLDLYGDETKANEVITRRANELGVSKKFLQDVASQSPKAFFAQLGVESAPNQRPVTPSRGEVHFNDTQPGHTKAGSYEYYEQLRKTDPGGFFSPKIQNQLMKDAMDGRYVPPEE